MLQGMLMMLGTLLSWAGFQCWLLVMSPLKGDYPYIPYGSKLFARCLMFFLGLLLIMGSWMIFRVFAA